MRLIGGEFLAIGTGLGLHRERCGRRLTHRGYDSDSNITVGCRDGHAAHRVPVIALTAAGFLGSFHRSAGGSQRYWYCTAGAFYAECTSASG